MKIESNAFKKLKDWTPSSKVQDLLGLSKTKYKEAAFKLYLKELAESSFLLTEGARKGLKYKLNPDWKDPESPVSEESSEEDTEYTEDIGKEALEDIETFTKNRDSISKSLKAKNSLMETLLWLTTNTPVATAASISIGFRKSSDGLVTVTLYNGLSTLRRKQFDSDSFEELLKKSLNADNAPALI